MENVTCQALLMFPAAIKPRLNTLVKERPAQQPPGSPKGTQHQRSLPCPPNPQLEELQAHTKQQQSNTSDHTLTAHEMTRVAFGCRTIRPSSCSVLQLISFSLTAKNPPAEELSNGWGRAGQPWALLSNRGHEHRPGRGWMAALNFALEWVSAE